MNAYTQQIIKLENYIQNKYAYAKTTVFFWAYLQTYFQDHHSKRLIINKEILKDSYLFPDKLQLIHEFLSLIQMKSQPLNSMILSLMKITDCI